MQGSNHFAPVDLTNIEEDSCHAPDIALGSGSAAFVCYQKADLESDQIWGGWVVDEVIAAEPISDGTGLAFRPRAVVEGASVWVFWTEYKNGCWYVKARLCREGRWEPAITIRKAEGAFYVSAAACNGEITAVWSEQNHEDSCIMSVRLTKDGIPEHIARVSEASQAYRPAVAADGQGRWYTVYDYFNGENYEIAVSVYNDGRWQKPEVISQERNWAASVSIASGKKGISVCWQDFKDNAHINYWQSDVMADRTGKIYFRTKKAADYVSWSIYSDIASDKSGRQAMIYGWNGKLLHMRYRKYEGEWSKPVELFESDTSYCIRPRMKLDENGWIQLVYQHSNGNGQHERKSSVSYLRFQLDSLKGKENPACEQGINSFLKPIEAQKSLDRLPQKEVREWLDQRGLKQEVLLFGDIHGHSNLSDGLGEADQYYHRAEAAGLDFTALTDHDVFPDALTPSEWKLLQKEANRFNTIRLKTLIAYEWTSNELRYNFGHKNIYYRGDEGGFYPCCAGSALTPDRLFEVLKQEHPGEAIVIPHHPTAVWRIASAATDWDFHDEELQRLVEVVSRHALSEYYGSCSDYTKNNRQLPHKSAQDALELGYHLGLIGGSDSHQMEQGREGGILAAFMGEDSRKGLFDALYSRRVYATTGAGILLDFHLNGYRMGETVMLAPGEKIRLHASVMGTNLISRVEVVRNGETPHVLEPFLKSVELDWCDTFEEDAWYYIRVTQQDRHMAWSSPVWVTR